MESSSISAILSIVAAFFSAAILVPRFFESTKGKINSSKRQSQALGETSIFTSIVRNGVSRLKKPALFLMKSKLIKKHLVEARIMLEEKGLKSKEENLGSLFCLGLLVCFFVGTLLGLSWFFGLIVCGGYVAGLLAFINHQKDARDEKIREAVPDALRSMSVCAQSGLSLQQSFEQVASEIKDPLKQLFVHCSNDFATGRTTAETLERFQKESGVEELSFVAVALDVQHKAGGSLRQVLDSARDSVESELELKRNLRVQTAQAKLSARIISLMPFVLLILFSFLSPGFLSPFFASFEGFALLGLAIAMQLSGIIAVRRLLDVGRG